MTRRMRKVLVLITLYVVYSVQSGDRPNIVWLTTEDNAAHWYRLYNPNGAPVPNVLRDGRREIEFDFSSVAAAPWSSSLMVVERRVAYLRQTQ